MIKNFEEAYAQEQDMIRRHREAGERGDKEAQAAIRAERKAWGAEVDAMGDAFVRVYCSYSESMERHNKYLDFHEVIWDKDVKKVIDTLRRYGIEKFTFSSGWSSAVETAWLFQMNGCRLEGLVEVNGCRNFTDDGEDGGFEKRHGYLFSVN